MGHGLKTVRFDVYQLVDAAGNAARFAAEFKRIAALPADETRTVQVADAAARLHTVETITCGGVDVLVGDFIRIRLNQFPLMANTKGATRVYEFANDEGLGEETAFLYDPITDIAILQRNRLGVSATGFAAYCSKKSTTHTPVFLDPILKHDVLKQLVKMDVIKKLDVRVAKVDNADILRDQGVALSSMATIMKSFHGRQLEIAVSMGRKKGSLSASEVIEFAKRCLSHRDALPVDKMVASGKDQERGDTVLDLLECQMSFTVKIGLDEKKRLHYQDRKAAAQSAWEQLGADARHVCGL